MADTDIVKLKCTFTLAGSTEKIVDVIEIRDGLVPFGVNREIERIYGVPVDSLSFFYI